MLHDKGKAELGQIDITKHIKNKAKSKIEDFFLSVGRHSLMTQGSVNLIKVCGDYY